MTTIAPTYLETLEAESIHIVREVAAESERPTLLFSGGKDSIVLALIAHLAFAPAPVPFPALHVDTGHNFPEVIEFRDRFLPALGFDLVVASLPEMIADGRMKEPCPGASRNRLQIPALLGAVRAHRFDALLGGARRDEEKARAKERVFSFRDAFGQWNPRAQRPEVWNLYNARVGEGETVRVFPLSNWTELDIWLYIEQENIPIVPLYFAKERPVVEREGQLIMVDDERLPLAPGETPQQRLVRFRTLGCYPLTGAVESDAATLPEIIGETLAARTSERQGRVIDKDGAGAMERKKQEGYF
ncbi:MAG: sulfate adenylyltransferase subunit CysD [Parafilimonas terrae]|nr:sulfate adenylyltransferase subunit CysD [Parafilimonas terrae]